jgi:hypothetical protein
MGEGKRGGQQCSLVPHDVTDERKAYPVSSAFASTSRPAHLVLPANLFCRMQCGGGGMFDTFVMTTVASEDASRPAWPSCPAQGWSSGVDRLTSFPNGQPMHTAGKSAAAPGRAAASEEVAARVVGACAGSAATCTSYTGLDYAQGVINKTAPAASVQECCDACAADASCFAASWVASTSTCWFKPDGGKSFTWTDGVVSVFPAGHAAPPLPLRTIEV